MAIKKLQLSEDVYEKLYSQAQEQTESEEFNVSDDPDVVVFNFEPMKRYSAYIPNIKAMINGVLQFPKVRGLSHQVYKNGKYIGTYRCIKDLVISEFGYDGTCPLCEGKDDAWEHYNMKLEAKCVELGLDPEDKENESVKGYISDLSKTRELQEPKAGLYWPMIFFETDKNNKILFDEEGKPKCSAQVYGISEYSYNEIWVNQMVNAEVEDIAGQLVTLSYVYDPKGKQPSKRDAGKALQITFKNIPEELKPYLEMFDAAAKELSPRKIESALAPLALYPVDELEKIKNKALAVYQQLKSRVETRAIGAGNAQKTNAEDILKSFEQTGSII